MEKIIFFCQDVPINLSKIATATTSDSLPSTTPGVPGSQLHMSSPHLEYLVMAGVLAAGMIMGVSVIGCYKLCCRRGSYVEPPSKSGEIRYRVKDDLVFLCVKNVSTMNHEPFIYENFFANRSELAAHFMPPLSKVSKYCLYLAKAQVNWSRIPFCIVCFTQDIFQTNIS